MDPITIIIRTLFEIPKVIIKTTCVAPKVIIETSTSGGGCAGAISGIVIVVALLIFAIKGCSYVVETYIIKGMDPNYVTSFEKAEEKNNERRRITEKPQNMKNSAKAYFQNKGINFGPRGYFAMDSHIWCCGNLYREHEKDLVIVMCSDDDGKNWDILSSLIKEGGYGASCDIMFLNKNTGFIYYYGGTHVYKTEDGGKNWSLILSTDKIDDWAHFIANITINRNEFIIATEIQDSFNAFARNKKFTFESYDCGKNWVYIQDDQVVAKTSDNGVFWLTARNRGKQ